MSQHVEQVLMIPLSVIKVWVVQLAYTTPTIKARAAAIIALCFIVNLLLSVLLIKSVFAVIYGFPRIKPEYVH